MASCRLASLVSLAAALLLAGCEARPAPAPAPRAAADDQATQTTLAPAVAQDAPAASVEGAARAGVSPQFARNVDEAMATLHRDHEGD